MIKSGPSVITLLRHNKAYGEYGERLSMAEKGEIKIKLEVNLKF